MSHRQLNNKIGFSNRFHIKKKKSAYTKWKCFFAFYKIWNDKIKIELKSDLSYIILFFFVCSLLHFGCDMMRNDLLVWINRCHDTIYSHEKSKTLKMLFFLPIAIHSYNKRQSKTKKAFFFFWKLRIVIVLLRPLKNQHTKIHKTGNMEFHIRCLLLAYCHFFFPLRRSIYDDV